MRRAQPEVHHLTLPCELLARGFWLYVWKIGLKGGKTVHYVGMTGDTGAGVAQSPMNRLSAHLSSNSKNNTLSRKLGDRDVKIEDCLSLDFYGYGPILSVPTVRDEYKQRRGSVAALERKLWQSLEEHGFELLNKCPGCRFELDETLWHPVLPHFLKILRKQEKNKRT